MNWTLKRQHSEHLSEARAEADASRLEREINQLVYQLYDLTEEEIKIGEGKE